MLAITHVDHRPPLPDDRIATMGRSYGGRVARFSVGASHARDNAR